jgi:hypothetical protein
MTFSSNDQQNDFKHLWHNILDFFGGLQNITKLSHTPKHVGPYNIMHRSPLFERYKILHVRNIFW